MNKQHFPAPLPQVCIVTCLYAALLLTGCAAPRSVTGPLAPSQLAEIDARARTARELGVQLPRRGQGQVRIANAHAMSFGATTEATMQQAHGPVVVPVRIGDRRALAALSSGTSGSFTGHTSAQRLDIVPIGHPLKKYPVSGPLSEHAAYMAMARVLRLGPLHIYNVPIGVLDEQGGLSAIWWLPPGRADLVLGVDFLRAFALVTFDFPAQRVLASHSDSYRPSMDRLVSAVSMKRGTLPVVDVMINDNGPFPVLIDTALGHGLWMPIHMADMLSVEAAASAAPAIQPYIPAGTATLSISGFTATNLPVVVTAPAHAAQDLPYAVLGTQALRAHRLTLDFKARKVYIERP